MSWSSDHIELILLPGEYTIFWHTDYAIRYYIYSHGWFMTDLDDPKHANDAQNVITMVAGIYGAIVTLGGICLVSGNINLRSDKQKESTRNKRLVKDEIKLQKLQKKMQKKADKKSQ